MEDSAREMCELKGKLLQQQAAMREALSVMAAAFRRQLRQRQSEAQVGESNYLQDDFIGVSPWPWDHCAQLLAKY